MLARHGGPLVAYILAAAAMAFATVAAAYSMWSQNLRIHVAVETGQWSDNVAFMSCCGSQGLYVNISNVVTILQAVNSEVRIVIDDVVIGGRDGEPFCAKTVLKIVNPYCVFNNECRKVMLLKPRYETLDGETAEINIVATEDNSSQDCTSCTLPSNWHNVEGTIVENNFTDPVYVVIMVKGLLGEDGRYELKIDFPALLLQG
jgi:hypothetical protein